MSRAELMRIKMKFMFHVMYNEVKKKKYHPLYKTLFAAPTLHAVCKVDV